MNKVTICKYCVFAKTALSKAGGTEEITSKLTGACSNPRAPIHDFVTGESLCHEINTGNCKLFIHYAGNSNKGKQT